METTNVIAAQYDHRVQRNADYEVYFKAKDADGNFISWIDVPGVRAEVRNSVGAVAATFEIGDGLEVDGTDNTILFLRKKANEKNISAGIYDWDLKVSISDEVA